MELICAPSISTEKICFLKIIIDEYLEGRKDLFPDISLRPKHHFLAHYATLTLRFGPLMRLWTMRFESKHGYFKKCLRRCQNYKNVTKTLSERHQLLQAYFNSGSLLPATMQVKKSIPLHCDLFADYIADALAPYELTPTNSVVSEEISWYGTAYKKGLYVPVSILEDNSIRFGCILMIIITECKLVFLVVNNCSTVYLEGLGVYELLHNQVT